MTTGTKDSSIKDDLDSELPKIGLKRSKDPVLTKESHQNRDRHKDKRHRHHHHHHRHGHRHKGTQARDKTDGDVFPKALKPLNELHVKNSNEENGKKHHSKIKKTAHDEWKKYVPPLFSVASDNGSDKKPKEVSYGERQRVLYDKLNNTLNVKKHQKLYKAHHIKPKKSNLPRQQLKSSVLKSPKKQSKIKSNEQEKRKRKPNFEKRKIIFDSTFSDPHRNTLTRLRRPSEQSESSTCTSDSFSSSFSSSSSMCKSETEPESISDSLVPPSLGLHISDDELDKINKNLTKKKGKSKKRHKSLDQRRPVVVLTPLRSHSCIEKHNQQPDKVGIFDIMEKEIAVSPSSIKCETEEQDSPSIDVGKLKEKFEIFRNSLKKSRSEKRLSMSTENKSNELSKTISMPEIGAECVDGDIESDTALYKEKVKLQVQILKQRMKSGIQKKIPPIESDMKIDRHFLDVLGEENDDQGQDSELKDFTSEMDESAELAENLSHIKIEPPEESNDIIDLCDYESPLPTIVRNNKVETHKTGVIKKEVIREIDFSDESPLPTIFRHYNVEAFRTNPVIPFSRIERNNSVETGKTVQNRKEVGKEIIEDFESPLPKITRSYNVEAYRTYPFKSEPDGCEENTGIIQSSQYGSHFPRIVGNYDVETLKAGQNHMEIEPESMTVSDTVCSKNASLLMEPVGEKRDNNFREFESVEEPQQFSELNIIQMPQVVADLNLNNINLSKTNLYASSVPLHQLQLHDKNLYVSELPLVRIEISGTNAAITQSGNDMDTWSPKNQISPVKDQPPITNFFAPLMKKTGDSKNSGQELISEIEPKIDKDTANKNNPDSDIVEKSNIIKGFDIKGCSVKLERLKKESLSKMMKSESEDLEDFECEKYSDSSKHVESKILRQRDGRKRKVSCHRLTSCTESSFSSQDSSSHGHNIELRQLEYFMKNIRISKGCDSGQNLPLPHANICASLQDDGTRNISHLLEFLYAFRYFKPNFHVLSQVIIAFSCEVEKEIVYEAFHLLQEMNYRFAGVIKVDWKVIERCLDILQQRNTSELAFIQPQLLLKLLINSLKLDLFTKNLSEQREVRQSMAYKILNMHSPCSRDLIKHLGLLLSDFSDGKHLFSAEIIQELLEISVDVSFSRMCQAGRLAEHLKTVYKDLPGIERKTTLVNSIKSSLIRYKLTELLLESEYTGTSPLSAHFPDSVLQIMECFFKAVPVTPVLGTIEFTSEHCEELAMLLYYMVTSYIECCRCLTNESLRSRAVTFLSQVPITTTVIDETSLLLEYVEDFLDHLLSLNSELTPATEHYIQMLQCLSDLDS